MTNKILLDTSEFEVAPNCCGISTSEDGETQIFWALFDVSKCQEMIEQCEDGYELGGWLTGWDSYNGGPGRKFAREAYAKVTRSRVLVTQDAGWDI